MPPQLALVICSSFVIYLLRFDRLLCPDVSRAVLLPTLWVFSIATKPLAIWFSSAGADEYGSPWDQYFLIALLVLGLVVLTRRHFNWGEAVHDHLWLFIIIGYMLISIAWSDFPFTGAKRWVRQIVAVVMVFVVLSEKNPRQAVECILRRCAYVLIPFSKLLIKYYPFYGVEFHHWSGERMWIGVSQQKNGLARVCIIALLFLCWDMIRRWRGHEAALSRNHARAEGIVLLLGLYMFLLPDGKASATSIAAFTTALLTLSGLTWLRRHHLQLNAKVLTLIVFTLVAFGISLPMGGNGLGAGVSGAMGRDSTLTGRADTWAEMVPIAMEHPILGCGFDSYWTPVTREFHKMSHAHSSYLEVFNELGAVGLVIFALFLLSIALAARRTLEYDSDWGDLCIAYVLMAIVHGMAESSINSLTCHLLGTLLLLWISCTSICRRSRVGSVDEPLEPAQSGV